MSTIFDEVVRYGLMERDNDTRAPAALAHIQALLDAVAALARADRGGRDEALALADRRGQALTRAEEDRRWALTDLEHARAAGAAWKREAERLKRKVDAPAARAPRTAAQVWAGLGKGDHSGIRAGGFGELAEALDREAGLALPKCTCPVDPDGPDRGDPLSTCPVHGWVKR